MKARALFVAALGIAACTKVSTVRGPAVIDRGFPSRSDLASLAKTPLLPREQAFDKGQFVARWELAGPFPDPPWLPPSREPASQNDALAASVAERLERLRSHAVATPSMLCYAREIGRFVARHGRLPEDDLQAFAAGRCGVVPVAPAMVYALPPEAPTDEAIFDFIDKLAPRISAVSSPSAEKNAAPLAELGLFTGHDQGRHVVLAAFGVPKVRLTAVDSAAGKSTVRIRGTLLSNTAWVRGFAGHGPLDVRRCEATPQTTAVLPEFDLTCPLAPEDPYAVFDMLAAEPQAVLGRQALMLILSTGRPPTSTFESPVPVDGQGHADLLDRFNDLRARLNRPKLQDVPLQSETARALVAPYFAAADNGDYATLDRITLGMMAGWDVSGPLREAQFLSFRGATDDGNAAFLRQLLFFPSNRAVLLDANATRIALASVEDDKKKAIWGLLATYTSFEPRSYPEVEEAMLDDLDRQRQLRGRKPARRVRLRDITQVLDVAMDRLARGQLDPMQGLEKVLRTLSYRLQRPFQGRVAYAMAIDNFRPVFDDALTDADDVAVTVKIGFYAAPADHWGQYVSYVIFGKTADSERGPVTPKALSPTR